MKIIFVDQKHGASTSVVLKGWVRLGLSLCLLGLPVFLGYYGFQFAETRNNQLQKDEASQAWADGRPLAKGYVSSGFGRRLAPVTGQVAWHEGVDFSTAAVGEEVFAVAAGAVSYAGERRGYGKVVRLDHGNGLETLNTHDLKLLVKAGDVVKRGQIIALSGSTARSTSPHVHFEVHKNGRVVDPASYFHTTSR